MKNIESEILRNNLNYTLFEWRKQSGYIPFGAVQVNDAIANYFNEEELMIGLTYSAHPVACATALRVIDIYEEDNLINNAKEMGKYVDKQVQIMKTKHPSIGDFRC